MRILHIRIIEQMSTSIWSGELNDGGSVSDVKSDYEPTVTMYAFPIPDEVAEGQK